MRHVASNVLGTIQQMKANRDATIWAIISVCNRDDPNTPLLSILIDTLGAYDDIIKDWRD
jgi:hypothetical protein